ncbi:MAG: GNAT family N-acetyltransferase [Thermoguttaceae bacterium]
MTSPFEIRRFAPAYDRSHFDCGVPLLNDWLAKQVSQYQRRDLARTYVALHREDTRVLGYYALSMHRVIHDVLPAEQAKGLPRLDVPVILLGRLAVDKTVQGRGLGATLLLDALARSAHISRHFGVRAVEVDAFDESAKNFYLKYGFSPLLDDPNHLFLPMHVVRKLDLPEPGTD